MRFPFVTITLVALTFQPSRKLLLSNKLALALSLCPHYTSLLSLPFLLESQSWLFFPIPSVAYDQGRRMPCVLVCGLEVSFWSQQGWSGKEGEGQVSLRRLWEQARACWGA